MVYITSPAFPVPGGVHGGIHKKGLLCAKCPGIMKLSASLTKQSLFEVIVIVLLLGTKTIQYNADAMEISSCPQAQGHGLESGRQFSASELQADAQVQSKQRL